MKASPSLGIKQLWTTTLYTRVWDDHEAVSPSLIELFHRIQTRSPHPIASAVAPMAKSTRGLFESEFDLFQINHPAISQLVRFIEETVRVAVSHINGAKTDPATIQVEFLDSWFHITTDGGFHDAHYHPGCSWCGIMYIALGDMTRTPGVGAPNGLNRFYSPINSGGAYRDFGNRYLEQSLLDIPPQDGMLLLFPSYLLHSALPYRGDRERIVVSFNCRCQQAQSSTPQ